MKAKLRSIMVSSGEETVVHCPQADCEANKNGICSLNEIFFYSDSRYPFICSQMFTSADRAQGYIPSWEKVRQNKNCL